ncbi:MULTISPECIES: DUF262 domain-containing protein [Stenotrophomonas]|uniref:DUF262 domain-containing protein n=1 Tax=Stenotrophomonas maltophilia group TaxID=995085 RepID=UPI002DB8129C|nr:DUF262 domain-containing protein [Stenotrophomonas pavanii]MEC4339629.1 DUF262 domain-containing protein [Stenotrophomonas pavanii]
MSTAAASVPLTNTEAEAIVRPLSTWAYSVDISWAHLARALKNYAADYGLNLDPDYQRGRVWTQQQQVHYLENVFRGLVPAETMVIQWACPHWDDHLYAGELPREMQILDGLQRLTTALRYLDGELRPFGRSVDDFKGTQYDVSVRSRWRFRFGIHAFQTREALLSHYLDLNTGGTPHSEAEIARVRSLLEGAQGRA